MIEQYSPFERHSQYNFKHLVFLHEQIFAIFNGKVALSVIQIGQHSGAHGKGERKQLQLYLRH